MRKLRSAPLAILTCPGCGRGGLRVPDGRRGKVTCPCGAEWFHPETVEYSEVEFRCSESGSRFVVVTSRRSPLHKFVIQGLKRPVPRQATKSEEPNSSSPQDVGASVAATPNMRLTGSKRGGWLARIAGQRSIGKRQETSSAFQQQPISATSAVTAHDASEYNWSSFFCPYCNATNFVSCQGGHLACDGTVALRGGRPFHQCFCGAAGFITGTIKTIEGKYHSMQTENGATDRSASRGTSVSSTVAALPPRER
jgi:hypothetical protein